MGTPWSTDRKHRSHRAARIVLAVAPVAGVLAVPGVLSLGLTPALAAPVSTQNACQDSIQVGNWAQIPLALTGNAPSSAAAGSPVTISGLAVTAELPASYLQAGLNLHVIQNGQTINGTIGIDIAATNATPATKTLNGAGTGTVNAPNNVAQPLNVTSQLPATAWTPSASGSVTLAQALSGTHHNAGVTAPTDGSAEIGAALLHQTNDFFLICRPGTSTGPTNHTFASSVTPFLSFNAGSGGGSTSSSSGSSSSSSSSTSSNSSSSTSSSTTGSTSSSTTTTISSGGASINLSSASGLAPGNSVTVTGTGFDPSASVTVYECAPGAAASTLSSLCDNTHSVLANADGSGAFTATFFALKTGAADPYGFTATDAGAACPPASGDCTITAVSTLNTDKLAAVPISFGSGTQVLGESINRPLARTGPGAGTLLAALFGLGLLDLGYLVESSTHPGRRLRRRLQQRRGGERTPH